MMLRAATEGSLFNCNCLDLDDNKVTQSKRFLRDQCKRRENLTVRGGLCLYFARECGQLFAIYTVAQEAQRVEGSV